MAQALPFLSVVIPAYQRPDGLAKLLVALADQSYPLEAFEVLVADDGSSPPLSTRVEGKSLGLTLRFLPGPNAGPATARERAWREARGGIVAFTDDDCLPEVGWLEAIAEAFADAKVQHAQGPVWSELPPIEGFVHSLELNSPEPGVATANYAVRRSVLQGVGGFDLAYKAPYFEDEDLARRISAKHGPPKWVAGMRVHHPPRPATWASLWRGAGFYYYLPHHERKHPTAWVGAGKAAKRRAIYKYGFLGVGFGGGLSGLLSGTLGHGGWRPVAMGAALFALGTGGLVAWQLKRLAKLKAQAAERGATLPLAHQLRFVLLEWALDFKRFWSYRRGLGYRPAPRATQADDPLATGP